MGHRRDRDGGNLHLLEGLLFIALLLIPVLVLQNQPLAANDPVARGTEVRRMLDDLLGYYLDAEDPDGVHHSYLDLMVARALQGDPALFESRVPRPLPKGVAFNVFLDQGQDLHRLRWDGTPPGEAVSASRLWTPGWGPVLAAPQVSLLDPGRSALRVDVVPLRGALGLTEQPGLAAQVTLQLPDGSTVDLRSFAPLGNATAAGPSVSLALLDETGAAVHAVEPAADNATLFLRLQETQGRAVPAGTTLQVLLPPGFRNVALRAEHNAGWVDLAVAGDEGHGWNVTADLAASLSNGVQQLMVNATRPGGARFHLIEARLDEGRLGQLQGLFLDLGNATTSAALPPGRGPFLSLPGRAPWSALAPAGLVVAYPDDLARTLTVTRVTLTPTGGVVLADAAGTFPASGAWTFADGILSWAGSESLANDEALDLRFQLRATAPPDPASLGRTGVAGALSATYGPTSRWQREPGVFALRAAGATATLQGFDATLGAHNASLNATHRGDLLRGRVDFATSGLNVVAASASDLARGLDESWLRVDAPRVALGGAGEVAWDLDRLVEDVVGAPASTFKCYTSTAGAWTWTADLAACLAGAGLSWQFVDEAPAVALRVHYPAPAAAGEVGALERELVGLPVAGSVALPMNATSLLGTHVVELRAEFRLTGPAGATAVQTVRFLAPLDVHRPGSAPSERPLYDLLLQAWLPEWG